MKQVFTTILVALSLSLTNCVAQQNQNVLPFNPEGKWYSFTKDGSTRETHIVKDTIFITSKSPYMEPGEEQIDTIFLEKLDDHHSISTRTGWDSKAILKFELNEDTSIISITPIAKSKDKADLYAKMNKDSIPSWISLQSMHAYSKASFDQIQQYPGLDEITREDLIKAFDARKDISPLLTTYVKANPNAGRYRLMSMVNDYRDLVMIKMGYNPYKMLKGDPYKRFENDAEVMRILNEPMSWEN